MDLGKLPDLVSAAELADCYRRCVALKEAMVRRQAGGGQRSGRYKKHDTARRRCLEKVAARAQARRAAVLRAGLRDAGVDLRA